MSFLCEYSACFHEVVPPELQNLSLLLQSILKCARWIPVTFLNGRTCVLHTYASFAKFFDVIAQNNWINDLILSIAVVVYQ